MLNKLLAQGTSLIARLMGAVRNSNTRASHASVEAASGPAGGAPSAGDSTKGPNNGATGGTTQDSPHLGPDTPDRRPSFSYLRRASDRRRRRRMLERGEIDPEVTGLGSPRQHCREFNFRRSSAVGAQGSRRMESESGLDSEFDRERRDSRASGASNQQQRSQLHRSDQIYDEEGEQLYATRALAQTLKRLIPNSERTSHYKTTRSISRRTMSSRGANQSTIGLRTLFQKPWNLFATNLGAASGVR